MTKQYLYNLDKVWYAGKWESITVTPFEHIAFNVVYTDSCGYEFNLSGFDESIKFQTNYGWSLIEIDEQNLLLLTERNKIEAKQLELKQEWRELSNKIKTIENSGVQYNENMDSDSTE